ncbi:MAG: hypothetical protein R2715_11790 [Ilumatobacteraceae bacterium]
MPPITKRCQSCGVSLTVDPAGSPPRLDADRDLLDVVSPGRAVRDSAGSSDGERDLLDPRHRRARGPWTSRSGGGPRTGASASLA